MDTKTTEDSPRSTTTKDSPRSTTTKDSPRSTRLKTSIMLHDTSSNHHRENHCRFGLLLVSLFVLFVGLPGMFFLAGDHFAETWVWTVNVTSQLPSTESLTWQQPFHSMWITSLSVWTFGASITCITIVGQSDNVVPTSQEPCSCLDKQEMLEHRFVRIASWEAPRLKLLSATYIANATCSTYQVQAGVEARWILVLSLFGLLIVCGCIGIPCCIYGKYCCCKACPGTRSCLDSWIEFCCGCDTNKRPCCKNKRWCWKKIRQHEQEQSRLLSLQ